MLFASVGIWASWQNDSISAGKCTFCAAAVDSGFLDCFDHFKTLKKTKAHEDTSALKCWNLDQFFFINCCSLVGIRRYNRGTLIFAVMFQPHFHKCCAYSSPPNYVYGVERKGERVSGRETGRGRGWEKIGSIHFSITAWDVAQTCMCWQNLQPNHCVCIDSPLARQCAITVIICLFSP